MTTTHEATARRLEDLIELALQAAGRTQENAYVFLDEMTERHRLVVGDQCFKEMQRIGAANGSDQHLIHPDGSVDLI